MIARLNIHQTNFELRQGVATSIKLQIESFDKISNMYIKMILTLSQIQSIDLHYFSYKTEKTAFKINEKLST